LIESHLDLPLRNSTFDRALHSRFVSSNHMPIYVFRLTELIPEQLGLLYGL